MVVDNLPAVDLSGLSGERLKEAKQLLYDGHESFAQDDEEVFQSCKRFTFDERQTYPEKLYINTSTFVPEVKG